jgi:alcohol dehydrogenase class IV
MSLDSFEKNLWIARTVEFGNPEKIIFGVNCVGKIGVEAKHLEAKKAVLVTERTMKNIGILEKITEPIEKEGINYELYEVPTKEPDMDTARSVVAAVREHKYDLVIGVGGGSCMDLAKLAATMAENPGDVSDYCARVKGEVKKLEQKTLPKILVPTTSGTGSECSNTLVVIDEDYKTWITDNKLLANVAIIDPTLALTMPPRVTAGTGMDALSHSIEGLLSRMSNPISDALAFQAVKMISGNLRTAYNYGKDLEARWNMSLAASLGGWVIGFPWVGGPANLGHCIAEAIGSKYRIPHGVACGLVLPYIMEFNLPACTKRLAEIANVMDEDVSGGSIHDDAIESVKAVRRLMRDVELPTSLKEIGTFPKEDIQDFARYLVEERQYMYDLEHYNPRRLTLENITELLEVMWKGEG